MRFADRHEAGRLLAKELERFRARQPVLLALPRGGVPVAFEAAQALGAPLDLVLVRKIGAPFEPELAIGAIVDGGQIDKILDQELIDAFSVSQAYLDETIARETREIERRRQAYLRGRPPLALAGKTAIVVDDGIATGATMTVALRAIRRRHPAALVLAVPVAPSSTLERLRREVDDAVCLHAPEDLHSIGQYYVDFRQLEDPDVIELLDRAAAPAPPAATA